MKRFPIRSVGIVGVLTVLVLLGACSRSQLKETEQQKLYRRLFEAESEYLNKNTIAQNLLNRIESKHSQILWSTNNHTAAPVPLGAVGPSKYINKLKGIVQNDSIGRVLKDAVNHHINVIFVVGDGMGNMHMALSVYMNYINKSKTPTMFEKIMREGVAGYNYTCTAAGLVTGSAASGTALATGTKTLMNMLAVDPDGQRLTSALEIAHKNHYKTALVTNAPITDATPAVFYAHTINRNDEDSVAHQLYSGNLVDVILGGGGGHFLPAHSHLTDFFKDKSLPNYGSDRDDQVNLLEQFQAKGYQMAFNLKELNDASSTKPLIGLFAQGGLPAVIDYPKKGGTIPSVNDMASKALESISSGTHHYFAMIECGRIDWEAHDNDVSAVYAAVLEMNEVLKTAYSYYRKDPEHTLLVFTADHETGGLEIAYHKVPVNQEETKTFSDGRVWRSHTFSLSYNDFQNVLMRQSHTVSSVLSSAQSVDQLKSNVKKYLGVDLSKDDAQLLFYTANGYKRYKDKTK